MPTAGCAMVHLRLPDQSMSEQPLISHTFEVTEPGGMPDSLIISGVDFWDKLKSKISWEKRSVKCTTAAGEKFEVPFRIGDSKHADVLTVNRYSTLSEGDRLNM